MELVIRLEKFKGVFARKRGGSDDLSFVSVEIDRNNSLTLPQRKYLCHRGSRDQPPPGPFLKRPREAEKRDPGNEIGI